MRYTVITAHTRTVPQQAWIKRRFVWKSSPQHDESAPLCLFLFSFLTCCLSKCSLSAPRLASTRLLFTRVGTCLMLFILPVLHDELFQRELIHRFYKKKKGKTTHISQCFFFYLLSRLRAVCVCVSPAGISTRRLHYSVMRRGWRRKSKWACAPRITRSDPPPRWRKSSSSSSPPCPLRADILSHRMTALSAFITLLVWQVCFCCFVFKKPASPFFFFFFVSCLGCARWRHHNEITRITSQGLFIYYFFWVCFNPEIGSSFNNKQPRQPMSMNQEVKLTEDVSGKYEPGLQLYNYSFM